MDCIVHWVTKSRTWLRGFHFRKGYRKNPALFSLERAPARYMEFVLFPPLWSSQRGANTIAPPPPEPSCIYCCLEPQCPLFLDSCSSHPSPTPPEGVCGLAASQLRVTPCTVLPNHHHVLAESPRIVIALVLELRAVLVGHYFLYPFIV